MGHVEHHDIDHAVREVKVYVPVVVPARIAELVRAVLVRHRAGPHELRDRLLEFAPQAGVPFHDAGVVRLEGRLDLDLVHGLLLLEERHESVDIVKGGRIVGDEAELLRLRGDQSAAGLLVRDPARRNDLERDPALVHQLVRRHDNVSVVAQPDRSEDLVRLGLEVLIDANRCRFNCSGHAVSPFLFGTIIPLSAK